MSTWTSSCNDEIAGGINFGAELAKEIATKGSFDEDYLAISQSLKLISPCPFIKSIASPLDAEQASSSSSPRAIEKSSVRVSNAIVDLSSWRVMLLAMSTTGTKIKELTCHGVKLSGQHLTDLILTVEKMNSLTALNLEYLVIDDEEEKKNALLSAIQQVLSGNVCIENISLKGSKLGDKFILDSLTQLQGNLYLQTLNLADNQITDAAAVDLLSSLRMNPALKEISLAKNMLGSGGPGIFAAALAAIITGSGNPAGADEDNISKALVKAVADKNKSIKDINKKKKLNPPIPELANPEPRIFKVDGVNVLINKTLTLFDLSHNADLMHDENMFLSPFIEILKAKGASAVAAAGAATTPYVCICKGKANFPINEQIAREGGEITPEIQFIV